MRVKTILAWISIALGGAIGAVAGEVIKDSWPESKDWALKKLKEIGSREQEKGGNEQ